MLGILCASRQGERHNRRRFLKTSLASGAVAGRADPAAPAVIVSDKQRPVIGSGIQIGDVGAPRHRLARAPHRAAAGGMDRSERFAAPQLLRGPWATEASDFTARVDLRGLPAGEQLFLRVRYEDAAQPRALSEPVLGRFRTAPLAARDLRFVWSGDTAGQGYGINPDWGGMRIYETMRRQQPDFFVHCGDTIYADGPMAAEVAVEGGKIWRNLLTPEVSKVAETLDEYRGRYRYNLMDANVRRFAAEVPQIWQWDDHEVVNNWSDGKDLSADPRYREKHRRAAGARHARLRLRAAAAPWQSRGRTGLPPFAAGSIAGRVRAGHAQLSRRQRRQSAARRRAGRGLHGPRSCNGCWRVCKRRRRSGRR